MKRILCFTLLFASVCSAASAARHQPRKAKSVAAIEARLLKRHDGNGDGVIERAEFKGKTRKFEKIDANRDGRIDAAELHEFAVKKAKRSGGIKRNRVRR